MNRLLPVQAGAQPSEPDRLRVSTALVAWQLHARRNEPLEAAAGRDEHARDSSVLGTPEATLR